MTLTYFISCVICFASSKKHHKTLRRYTIIRTDDEDYYRLIGEVHNYNIPCSIKIVHLSDLVPHCQVSRCQVSRLCQSPRCRACTDSCCRLHLHGYSTVIGFSIQDPFSQSRDSGISNPGIPAGLWDPDPGGMISKIVIIEYIMGLYLQNFRVFLSQRRRPVHLG